MEDEATNENQPIFDSDDLPDDFDDDDLPVGNSAQPLE